LGPVNPLEHAILKSRLGKYRVFNSDQAEIAFLKGAVPKTATLKIGAVKIAFVKIAAVEIFHLQPGFLDLELFIIYAVIFVFLGVVEGHGVPFRNEFASMWKCRV
jgi:hypothetical protein